MINFKSFIAEHKIAVEPKDLLALHVKHHEAGVPLPDRTDLYRGYIGGHIRYPKEDGGYIEHNVYTHSISHFSHNEVLHNITGPAFTDLNSSTWSHNGTIIADYRHHSYPGGPGWHTYTTHAHYSGPTGGSAIHDVSTLGELNAHLAKHDLPPFEHPE